jgi:hypothetical protein
MDLFAAVFSFAVLGLLWLLLEKTKVGLGIRASAIDTLTASLMGIDNNRVALIIFGISGVLSAVAGVFFGIKYTVYPYLGLVTIKAMIASILGGVGACRGRGGQPSSGDHGDHGLRLRILRVSGPVFFFHAGHRPALFPERASGRENGRKALEARGRESGIHHDDSRFGLYQYHPL